MKKLQILFLIIIASSIVSAANIGVSPARINFENVLRNGYAQRPVIVTIDSQQEVQATVQKRGEIADWLDFSEQNFSVEKGSPHQIIVSVSPPDDIPNGNYSGFVTIKTTKLANPSSGQTTGIIIPSLDIYVVVQITDNQVVSCKASNFKVSSAEEGDDIVFTMDILNDGNVRFKPKVTMDFWDQSSVNLVKQEDLSADEITPTKKQQVTIRIPSDDFDLGQYWVDVSAVDCYSSQTLTFDVLEVGALRAYGVLEKIFAKTWAEVGDIVEITTIFRNDGEKPLETKFKGQISYNNKVIQLIEDEDPTLVQIGEEESSKYYFTPRNPGKYVISGRVFYDSKRTYEQTTIVNVKPKTITFKLVMKVVIYTILIILIVILIFKIRKERKSLSRRPRKLR